jgi:hypothetical protein
MERCSRSKLRYVENKKGKSRARTLQKRGKCKKQHQVKNLDLRHIHREKKKKEQEKKS